MFTGIVQAIGRIRSVEPQAVDGALPDSTDGPQDPLRFGFRLFVEWGDLVANDVCQGDSVAMNGACMTVLRPGPEGFWVDISRESLSHTAGLDQPGYVNLEKAMRVGDRLGGHLVSGHVDGTAEILEWRSVGESMRLTILIPPELAPFVTHKGSIALHGVSLTVNGIVDGPKGTSAQINLIPHTWQQTTFRYLAVGQRVNVEVDPLARQVARLLSCWQSAGHTPLRFPT